MRKISAILFLLCCAWSAAAQSLGGDWTLDFWEQGPVPVRSPEAFSGTPHETIPATVPGNVELDLLKAGRIVMALPIWLKERLQRAPR